MPILGEAGDQGNPGVQCICPGDLVVQEGPVFKEVTCIGDLFVVPGDFPCGPEDLLRGVPPLPLVLLPADPRWSATRRAKVP